MTNPFRFPHALRHMLLCGAALACSPTRAATPLSVNASPTDTPVLMRDPAPTATTVLFVARGELWSAPLPGGSARRLTTLGGEIERPRISPDGRSVAFALRRDGAADVYVLPVDGGEPKRLTVLNGDGADDAFPLGWTPDSRHVLFLSTRFSWAHKIDRPFVVSADGGSPEPFGLDHSGPLSFGPDGHTVVLTRFLTDLWARKRYLGGQAPALFLQDMQGGAARRLADWRGTSTDPMWLNAHTVLFLSDRGPAFRLNLWSLDLPTGHTRQLTHFINGDVDGPSLGPTGVVCFEQGGRLWTLDPASGTIRPIPVSVPDDGARTATRTVDALTAAQPTDVSGRPNYAVLPGGDLVLPARGALFRITSARTTIAAPAAMSLTRPGAEEDHPALSPDGHTLASLSVRADGTSLVLRSLAPPGAVGSEPVRQLPLPDGSTFFTPIWSPDGSRLILPDVQHRLWLLNAANGAIHLVATDPRDAIRDAAWSPDGHWLGFSTMTASRLHQLHLVDITTGRDMTLDDPLEDDRLPAFTPDGGRLLFASARNASPLRSDRDDDTIASVDADVVCVLSLPHGAAPASDALQKTLSTIPLPPGHITALTTRGPSVFVETHPPELVDGNMPGEEAALYRLDLKTLVPQPVLRHFDDLAIAPDASALAVRRDGAWLTAATFAVDGTAQEHALVLPPLPLRIDPRAEWAADFEQAWRLDRDVFLSRVMNGSDWQAVHDAYRRYLPLLGSDGDTMWLLRQLQGELATSHAFIEPADPESPSRPTPLLGADLLPDRASNSILLAHILRGDPTRPSFRAPLDGAGLSDGDVLRAINGHRLDAGTDPFALLAASHGPVTVSVSRTPDSAIQTLTVVPLSREGALRQLDHERAARARVSALSHGRLGYLFLSDFYESGTEDLWRQYAGQRDKEGLVIDVRWNRGGDTSQFVLDLLRRQLAGNFVNREGALEPLPPAAPRTLELVDNAATASDGDQFAYYFRSQHLGEVVGQRTWGGVQGINGLWMLPDGTGITIPKDTLALPDGRWIIENVGAVPDIAVDDAPLEGEKREGQDGADIQLDTAVRRLLARLDAAPNPPSVTPPPLPAYPEAGNVPGARFR